MATKYITHSGCSNSRCWNNSRFHLWAMLVIERGKTSDEAQFLSDRTEHNQGMREFRLPHVFVARLNPRKFCVPSLMSGMDGPEEAWALKNGHSSEHGHFCGIIANESSCPPEEGLSRRISTLQRQTVCLRSMEGICALLGLTLRHFENSQK